MPTRDPKTYLWGNIAALMRTPSPTVDAVTTKTKIGRGTVQRIKEGTTSVGVDILMSIAKAFHVEVWQLLVPDLDPDHLPTLHAPASVAWPFTSELLSATLEADVAVRRQAENAARACLDMDPLPRQANVRLA